MQLDYSATADLLVTFIRWNGNFEIKRNNKLVNTFPDDLLVKNILFCHTHWKEHSSKAVNLTSLDLRGIALCGDIIDLNFLFLCACYVAVA